MGTLIADTVQTDTIEDEAGAFEHARLVQVVNVTDSAYATGTTVIVADDSIPQITEGVEYMTLAITPTNASNKLLIQVITNTSNSSGGATETLALFQDTTTAALACVTDSRGSHAHAIVNMTLNHYMIAGTTSATTFRVRVGYNGGTNYFNGQNGARLFGGVYESSITISEIRV